MPSSELMLAFVAETMLFAYMSGPALLYAAAAFPVWLQFLILGTIVNVMLSSADLVCVYFAGAIVDTLRRSTRAAKVLEGLGGGILIGLGANLALQRS